MENLSLHLQAVHVVPPARAAQAAVVVVPAGRQQHSGLPLQLLVQGGGYLDGSARTISLQKPHGHITRLKEKHQGSQVTRPEQLQDYIKGKTRNADTQCLGLVLQP